METKFVGIDVSKVTLDFDCLPASSPRQFANDGQGIDALVEWLKGSGVERIVVEATGGYETAVASALAVATLPVVVVNPKQVRDFAKAMGHLAKTDRLDAKLLALFGERIMPPLRTLPDEAQRALADLLDRRTQLVTMRTQEKARLATVTAVARKNIQQHIAWLDKCIVKYEKAPDHPQRHAKKESTMENSAFFLTRLLSRTAGEGAIDPSPLSSGVVAEGSGRRFG